MLPSLGIQLFTVRDKMGNEKDIAETFHRLKEMGYDSVHTAGCSIPFADFGRLAKDAGLEICGTHEDFKTLFANPEQAMENHRLLGTKNMGIGGMSYQSLEDVNAFIKDANTLGDIIHPHGFKFTYHNHSHEFRKYGDLTTYQRLADGLNPQTCSFVLDTYWVQHGGGDVRHWIQSLAGRIDILHLKDMMRGEQGAQITEVGQGNLWWEGIIETALEAGVHYFVVEQDNNWKNGDPFESARISSEYLHKHFM